MERERPAITPHARHRGPHLGAVGIVHTVL